MRVLYISRGGNPHDHRFLSALAETEHEMYFLPLESSEAEERQHVPPNIKTLAGPKRSDDTEHPAESLEADGLRQILDQIQPDLVHAGPIQSGAYLAAQCDWHPLVSMSWGSDLLVEAESGEGKERAMHALRHSDVLICDCETVRQAAVDLGMPDNHTVVFPWGVDLESFSPGREDGLRKQLGWQDDFVILSTREWEPERGVDLIVEAFIKASRTEPSLRIVMLSYGSLRASLLAELKEEGASDFVYAPGPIESAELTAFYRSADLYVSASHSDGSSISLLEAMACGTPALVSDIACNREWVVPEDTGLWFEDDDADDLAAGILKAVASSAELAGMGARSRTVAVSRADWRANFQKLLEAYERVAVGVQHS